MLSRPQQLVRCEVCGKEGPLYAEMVGGTIAEPVLKYSVMHPRYSKNNPRPTRHVMFHPYTGKVPCVKHQFEDLSVFSCEGEYDVVDVLCTVCGERGYENRRCAHQIGTPLVQAW